MFEWKHDKVRRVGKRECEKLNYSNQNNDL